MSIFKQYHRAIEEESQRLAIERVMFGILWDKVMERRRKEEVYRKDEEEVREHASFVKNHFRRNR